MINRLTYVVAIGALGTAHAAGEFPYYPEFADLYSRYEEVTPATAKAATGRGEGEIAGEPLLLRDVTGMPYCYITATYAQADASRLEKWNEVIRKLNAGEPLDAAELAEEVKAYYAGDYGKAVGCQVMGAYTCEDVGRLVTEGFFPALSGYRSAYRLAASELGAEDIYFKRIIAFGEYTVQIFEFEDDAGEKTAVMVDEHQLAYQANLEENAAFMREAVRRLYNWFKENPDKAELNRERWQRISAENE